MLSVYSLPLGLSLGSHFPDSLLSKQWCGFPKLQKHANHSKQHCHRISPPSDSEFASTFTSPLFSMSDFTFQSPSFDEDILNMDFLGDSFFPTFEFPEISECAGEFRTYRIKCVLGQYINMASTSLNRFGSHFCVEQLRHYFPTTHKTRGRPHQPRCEEKLVQTTQEGWIEAPENQSRCHD